MPDTDPTADKSGLIARMAASRERHKSNAARLETELAEARRVNLELAAERDGYKGQADGSQTLKDLNAARAEIRDGKHRVAFDALAKSMGAKPEAVGDLYGHTGYKPEGDTADEAGMSGLIEAQKTVRPYLFAEAKAAATADEPYQPEKAKGGGQGGSASTARQFTPEQMGNAEFVMRNQGPIIQAARQYVERNG